MKSRVVVLSLLFTVYGLRFVSADDLSAASSPTLTLLHPLEGAKLPALTQVFTYGYVTPGSTLTINGLPVPVYATGGYLTMVPLVPGEMIWTAQAITPGGGTLSLERRISVSSPPAPVPERPVTIDKTSLSPASDALFAAGDLIPVSFRGSPGGTAEFSIEHVAKHLPMVEVGDSTTTRRGVYQGHYVVQPGDGGVNLEMEVALKKGRTTVRATVPGKIHLIAPQTLRVGRITEDTVAARTAPEGGYDLFLSKGMRVALTGRQAGHWRVRLGASQTGWVRESAVQELPAGTPAPAAVLSSLSTSVLVDSTLVRLSLSDILPYRMEQSLNPAQLVLTVYGATVKADFARYDPADTLVRQIRWRQTAPEVVQITLDTASSTWWGYDIRYEPGALVIEIRNPWMGNDLRGMIIAVDAGHGGSDNGAIGPRGLLEKDANALMAQAVADALTRAGAKPVLIRTGDHDVPLYDRPRLAWKAGARLFVSLHSNSSGVWENPLWNNGSSVYWYQPQSQALAQAIHAAYRKILGDLPDRGLFFADFAVCRMTQMPSVLIENAYIIVPDQEEKLFDPKFHKQVAQAVVQGIRTFVSAKP